MKQLTLRSVLARCRLLVLACIVLTLAPGGSALARPAKSTIHVAVSSHVKKNVRYPVTVTGFSVKKEKALVFIDYFGCGRTPAAEKRHSAPDEAYNVRGTFKRISFWRSAAAKRDHACAYLVSRKTGVVLVRASVTFSVR